MTYPRAVIAWLYRYNLEPAVQHEHPGYHRAVIDWTKGRPADRPSIVSAVSNGLRGGMVTVEDDVLAVSAVRDAALVRNDAGAIAGYMTDDWVYIGPTGVTPKADIIGWIASGRLAHHTMMAISDERVVSAGDAVLYTARKSSSGAWDGTPYTADEWITEVYIQVDGHWRCAFSQKTLAE